MIEYPKIETLFTRGEDFNVTDIVRLPEFGLIKNWYFTEKVHGQNIQIEYDTSVINNKQLHIYGRTARADLPKDLLEMLTTALPIEKFSEFGEGIVLYGEGYGAGINNGGNYSPTKKFVLFDVKIGNWWLEPDDVKGIAIKLGIDYVPELIGDLDQAIEMVKQGFNSPLALKNTGKNHPAEGIIAKTIPGLRFRNGGRVMFKLKTEDYSHGKTIKNNQSQPILCP